jgi:oxygen-dependent protoporphyrinogen oxidase
MRLLKEPFLPAGRPDPEESMASFTRRRFGEEAAARIFEPLGSVATGGDPEQLLARYTFPLYVEYERRSGSVLKGRLRAARTARREGTPPPITPFTWCGGLGRLPERIGAHLGAALRTGVAIEGITIAPDRSVVIHSASAGTESFDGAVVAIPAPAVGRLHLTAGAAPSLAPLASMPHASLVVVALGYRRAEVLHPLNGHGLIVGAREQRRTLMAQFTSSLFPGHAPADHVLLTVSMGGARQPNLVSLGDTALRDAAHEELRPWLGISGSPVMSEVVHWPAVLPLAVAGHDARVAAGAAVEAAVPQLAFAGMWHDGLLLHDVMRGGAAAATRLLGRL